MATFEPDASTAGGEEDHAPEEELPMADLEATGFMEDVDRFEDSVDQEMKELESELGHATQELSKIQSAGDFEDLFELLELKMQGIIETLQKQYDLGEEFDWGSFDDTTTEDLSKTH